MKNAPFILWNKLTGLFGQPNIKREIAVIAPIQI